MTIRSFLPVIGLPVIGLLALGLVLPGPILADPIAVVVHPQSSVQDLTTKELKAAYEGYGLPGISAEIVLVYLRGDLEDAFNLSVLGVSSKKVKVYWLRRVFEGESDLRRISKTAAEVKAFVGANKECIGFVPAGELDGSVRAITIDGAAHGDPGYPLE